MSRHVSRWLCGVLVLFVFAAAGSVEARVIVRDGQGDGPPAVAALVAGNTDASNTYTVTSSGPSPFVSPVFGASTTCGLLTSDGTKVPYLRSQSFGGITSTDSVNVQFDFCPVSGHYEQWYVCIGESSSYPYDFDMQASGNTLYVVGRCSTSENRRNIAVPSITVVPGDWYHVSAALAPSGNPQAQRIYNLTVTRCDSQGNLTSGSLNGILEEDANPINYIQLWNLGNPSPGAGSIKIDNLIIEAGADTMADRMAYMPGYNTIRYVLDTWPSDLSNWQLQLKDSNQTVLATTSGSLPCPLAGVTWSVPSLAAGTYTLTSTLSGSGNPLSATSTFTRSSFPWENSTLGQDTLIVPPYTALVTDTLNNAVDCLLRRYTIGNAGLWSQVSSQGVSLLSSPMALNVGYGGQTYAATSSGSISYTTDTGNEVAGNVNWTAAGGNVTGNTSFDCDYDGMTRMTVTVNPTTVTVDSLTLVVPLNDSQATLMHEVTDDLRQHFAGSIPAGSGKVWDSSGVYRLNLPAPFVPYIWVGGPERGICWFAENDKDMILDPSSAFLELDHNGQAMNLVVHLINKSSVLTRTHTITFGLMATPAKTQTASPVPWRKWWPVDTSSAQADVITKLLASDTYWGSVGPCNNFYPAFRNYSIFNHFLEARLSGNNAWTNPNDPFKSTWMGQFTDPVYQNSTSTYDSSINWSFGCMQGSANHWWGGSARSTQLQDGLGDGAPINALSAFNTGTKGTYLVTANPSSFTSTTFGASTNSGLLTHTGTRTSDVPGLRRDSGLGIAAADWVAAQFDFSPVSGNYGQWQFTIGQDAWSPFAFDMRIVSNQLYVLGRYNTGQSRGLLVIPNIGALVAGDWYRVNILFQPVSTTLQATYNVIVTHRDGSGNLTYGAMNNVLQEDIGNPISQIRFWGMLGSGQSTGDGQIRFDNVLINRVKPCFIFPYTNPRGSIWDDELLTYMDEWTIYDLTDPRWSTALSQTRRFFRPDSGSYDALTGIPVENDPVKSYADMVLYYQNQMYSTFANGIYYDDAYLQVNYNPVSGAGYVGDDGKTHPGVNIFGFRDLIKRTATLQYKLGMNPFTYIHMTNANIVPLLSFGTFSYDWEWRSGSEIDPLTAQAYGAEDCQTRLNIDNDTGLVLAQSTGLQTGNVGIVNDKFQAYGSTSKTWLLRTAMAVTLTHEMKIQPASTNDAEYTAVVGLLETFGYGESDCQVYRYWDANPMATTSPASPGVRTLVVKRSNPDRALVIVAGYGAATGNCTFTLDPSLGIGTTATATDLESNTTLTNNSGAYTIPNLARHDFRLVQVQ